MATIEVVTHPGQGLPKETMVSALCRHWHKSGHSVQVGPSSTVTADVTLLHVDLTHVDKKYIPRNPLGRPLLNSSTLDISKRHISKELLNRDSRWSGPVIVKSDLNCGGRPELTLAPFRRRIFGGLERLHLKRALDNYRLFDSMDDVPRSIWNRPDLVVERFTPEIEDHLFSLRMWIFFGDQGYYERRFSPSPLVKAGNSVRTEYPDDPIPEKLIRIRREMGLDFGKLDFVMIDGEPVLLDVNKTPAVQYDASSERQRLLARGLGHYLAKEAA